MVGVFRYSGLWMIGSFVPPFIIKLTDKNNVPFTEIENFYKYIDERRKAEFIYKKNQEVTNDIKKYNPDIFEQVKKDLEITNKTVWDVIADTDEMYLAAAMKL